MAKRSTNPLIALVAVAALGACAQGDPRNPGTGTAVGAGTGAVVGGVLGSVLGASGARTEGAVIGAAVGAALGGGIGYAMDRQRRDFEQELAAERARNDVQIEQLRADLLRLTLDSDVQFAVDSAQVQPGLRSTLSRVADVLKRYPGTQVVVVGHTDATGSEAYNQELSERRAQAVRDELVLNGVPTSTLIVMGRGESEPRADNATDVGRAANRRVELLVTQPA